MKLKYLACLVPAGIIASSACAQIVNAPWAPNGSSSAELNLYSILGYADNPTLNANIVNQSGSAATTFSIPLGSVSTSFIVEYAGNGPNNSFGVYGASAQGIAPTSPLLQVISGAAPPSGSVVVSYNAGSQTLSVGSSTVSVAGDSLLGFYLNTGTLNHDYNTFYSTYINPSDFQHGVLFNNAPNYPGTQVIGWEDETVLTGTDTDYNDMVVSFSAVPEPSTMIACALMVLPFGASAVRILRRNRAA